MNIDHDQGMSEDTRRDLAEVMAALKVIRGGDVGKSEDKLAAGVSKLPGKGEWVKLAPGVAMVCATLIVVTFLTVFAVLAVTGTPTDPLFRLVNLFLNALGAIATLATLSVAMVHARRTLENRKVALQGQEEAHRAADSAEKAARSVNGDLDKRIARLMGPLIEESVRRAITRGEYPQEPGAPTRERNP